jgi:hypothetical protein
MPAGYSSRCKTCNSPYRLQIEAWHKDGVSPFGIETRLRALGEKISYHAIENHFQEHYDVQSVVQEQYYQSQANLEKEAQERVSEIKILDDVVQDKYRLHQMLDGLFKSKLAGLSESETPGELPKLPLSYVSLYTGCASEIRQTLKQKQEMLGEDPTSKEATSWTELIASVHSRRRSALRPGPE